MLANACGKVSTAKLTVAPSDVVAVYCMLHSSVDGGFNNDHHTQECSCWRPSRERISPKKVIPQHDAHWRQHRAEDGECRRVEQAECAEHDGETDDDDGQRQAKGGVGAGVLLVHFKPPTIKARGFG